MNQGPMPLQGAEALTLEAASTRYLPQSLIGIVLSLYMLAILLRWTGPWLEVNMRSWWMRTIAAVTDPLIALMRRILPHMGPVDWSPVAALAAVWLTRIVLARY